MRPEILLKAYVQYQSEDAFRELVAGTLNEVYSTSFRITRGAQRLAEEATFNAYLQLARSASGIREDMELASWLRKRACKLAVTILRREERDIDWGIVKKEKNGRSTSSELQQPPPGLEIYICKTVFLSVKSRRGSWFMLPQISWPQWIRPIHVAGAAGCAVALTVWWHHPFHRNNRIIRSDGPLVAPASLAQLADSEDWKASAVTTHTSTSSHQK